MEEINALEMSVALGFAGVDWRSFDGGFYLRGVFKNVWLFSKRRH